MLLAYHCHVFFFQATFFMYFRNQLKFSKRISIFRRSDILLWNQFFTLIFWIRSLIVIFPVNFLVLYAWLLKHKATILFYSQTCNVSILVWNWTARVNINPLQPDVAFLYPLKTSLGGIEKQHRAAKSWRTLGTILYCFFFAKNSFFFLIRTHNRWNASILLSLHISRYNKVLVMFFCNLLKWRHSPHLKSLVFEFCVNTALQHELIFYITNKKLWF